MHVCKKGALIAAVALALTAAFRPGVLAQRPPSAVREALAGIPVPLDRLEDQVDWYMGLTIAVEGRVDDVLGPRLFRVSDRTADGEVLVGVLAPAVAPVITGDLVRITGRMQTLAYDEFERSWNWLGLDAEAALEMALHPVLVATRVTANRGSAVGLVLAADAPPIGGPADATSAAVISDVKTLAHGDRALVGRAVALRDVTVAGPASPGGFFVQGPDRHVLVLGGGAAAIPRRGQRLSSVRGIVLEMPDNIEARLAPPGPMNDAVYIFSTRTGS